MEVKNATHVSLFTLSGLQDETRQSRYAIFFAMLLCYFLIVIVNVTLIVTILQEKTLQEPMYIFLCNMCINTLYGTAGFYPKFSYDILSEHHVISYVGCIIQVCMIYLSFPIDFNILTVMAFDRYVAICRPLEYHSIMTSRNVAILVILCWVPPILYECLIISLTYRLTLCGSHIDKLYCENWSIVRLSCSPTTVNNVVGLIIITAYLFHVFFIIHTYVKLIQTCLKSSDGRHKFLQTCLPHLFSLINATVALLFDMLYSRYRTENFQQGLRNFLALEFLIFPPILNPLFYGIQLTKVREAVFRRYRRQTQVIF
ncbi:putative gustatory receptor clone PTE03 [Conger conger]|uniref:putative gustatory receptor clone PTE03 n=1 Tax=Conger conger TaxID=82655 RepID=UPI002A5B0679|nr:putative gustatory receptor clone PTE03 [Conger conger]